jgi:hypothetical protein
MPEFRWYRRRRSKLEQTPGESENRRPAGNGERWQIHEFTSPQRVAAGLPSPWDDDDEIPELEFFERARERGLLKPRGFEEGTTNNR